MYLNKKIKPKLQRIKIFRLVLRNTNQHKSEAELRKTCVTVKTLHCDTLIENKENPFL